MTDSPDAPEPRFGDAEAERILRRAAELDAADKTRRGLTLRELEQIAAEAGIDPRHLAAAAAPIGNPETSGATIICPQCEAQVGLALVGDRTHQSLSCPRCRTAFTTQVVRIRSKSSRKESSNGRKFSFRVVDATGAEDLIEFTTPQPDDFEMRARDVAAFSYLKDQLTIVQNLTIGRHMKRQAACYIATFVYGPYSDEVKDLRYFRDNTLLSSRMGSALVGYYYEVSPWLVAVAGRNRIVAALMRAVARAAVGWVRWGTTRNAR